MKKIKTALVSVFNKDGIDNLCKELYKNNITILSTGGTKSYIEEIDVPVLSVESITNYPSILGGRVKTLHPKLFGAILSRSENMKDNEDTLKYIVDFSEEFSDLFLKNIKYKLMSHVSFILSQLKIENEFDKMWYPINTIDYQWAFDTLHKINELEQGFNIIKCRYINN